MADQVKVSKFGNVSKGMSRFVREIKSELKKVIWPNRQQLVNNTVTVLGACLVAGGIIWIADVVIHQVFKLIL